MSVFLADADAQLYCGDCLEIVPELPPVDAIVTSPPYSDARPDVPALPLDRYAEDFMRPLLAVLAPALKPRGSLLLNLGRRFRDGEEHPYIEDTLAVARETGWKRIDSLIWHKPNANARGGSYLLDKHEHVFWLARSTDAYRGFDADTRTPYAPDTVARFGRGYQNAAKFYPREQRRREPHPLGARPGSVVAVYVGEEKGNRHPSPMPLKLARQLVALSTPPGGTVLDPFVGSGTTLIAARELQRRSIGIDVERAYLQLAGERLAQQTLFTQQALFEQAES